MTSAPASPALPRLPDQRTAVVTGAANDGAGDEGENGVQHIRVS